MLLSLLAFHSSIMANLHHAAPATKSTIPHQNIIWNGHFSAKKFSQQKEDKAQLRSTKAKLRRAILQLPHWHTKNLKNIEIHNDSNISRGLSNSKKIILHTNSIDTDQELKSVFIHEVGHIVDLGALRGQNGHPTPFYNGKQQILSDDPSIEFYRLSWENDQTQKKNSLPQDFVSGYAQYDCFEDFAESYLLYRSHGEKFRKLMKESTVLQKKYSFLKEKIFNNKEFNLNHISPQFTQTFDATLL